MAFDRLAKNAFMDSGVSVKYEAQAKQHRNTEDADFAPWASYQTDFEQRVYEDFKITQSNRAKIGYTDDKTNLIIPATFQDEDGTWYRVTAINDNAFPYSFNLVHVTIPEGVITIGGAFGNCPNLVSVDIPNSVTSIAVGAFMGCRSLDLYIPDTVTNIGDFAFFNVSHIEYHGEATGAPWGALAIN